MANEQKPVTIQTASYEQLKLAAFDTIRVIDSFKLEQQKKQRELDAIMEEINRRESIQREIQQQAILGTKGNKLKDKPAKEDKDNVEKIPIPEEN